MTILDPVATASGRVPVIALFGKGLVGTGIVDGCCRLIPFRIRQFPFSWGDPSIHGAQKASVVEEISRLLSAGRSLAVVWSAGRGGFSASDSELTSERNAFDAVLELARRFVDDGTAPSCAFHFVSSAGGLFEGQRLVDANSVPRPLRPYGRMKQNQEEALSESRLPARIYRPSSVYGPIHPVRRMGIIPVLILNGLRRSVTSIFGHLTTLRDYVATEHVGAFIASRIVAETTPRIPTVDFLVSALPASILEIRNVVEQEIRHRVYLAMHGSPDNTGDITFSPELVPANWKRETFEAAVKRVHLLWQSQSPGATT